MLVQYERKDRPDAHIFSRQFAVAVGSSLFVILSDSEESITGTSCIAAI